jgi:uncharacterized protein YoxC
MSEPENSPSIPPEAIEEKIDSILQSFDAIMALRTDLTLRIGKRVTQIVRIATLGLLILAIAMLYLISTLGNDMGLITKHMREMNDHMIIMRENFEIVAQRMQTMETSVKSMSVSITAMPAIAQDVAAMDETVRKMQKNMININGTLFAMRQSMTILSKDVEGMRLRFEDLTLSLNGIGNNVNRMTQPFQPMPALRP